MKNTILILFALTFSIFSCNSNSAEYSQQEIKKEIVAKKVDIKTVDTEGLELMKQKCFICHFKTPDPSRRDEMVAPPMLRVQEHYLPNYPEKDNFVAAILEWVKNPVEENTLMPGALRKFKIMPKLAYDDSDITKIASYLYSMDFGDTPHMKGHDDAIVLNDGKKWKLDKETLKIVESISVKLKSFDSSDIDDYNQLGKDVFGSAKMILIGDAYSGSIFDQLQNFFHKVEPNMHELIATESIDKAKKEVKKLKKKFTNFNNYFE